VAQWCGLTTFIIIKESPLHSLRYISLTIMYLTYMIVRILIINLYFYQNFNETVPWEARTDTLISRFVHPIYTTNFRTLYNEEPHRRGHVMWIKGLEFDDIFVTLDNMTKYLHSKIGWHGLHDLNVVHLSDDIIRKSVISQVGWFII
jgi:hypothetical protein